MSANVHLAVIAPTREPGMITQSGFSGVGDARAARTRAAAYLYAALMLERRSTRKRVARTFRLARLSVSLSATYLDATTCCERCVYASSHPGRTGVPSMTAPARRPGLRPIAQRAVVATDRVSTGASMCVSGTPGRNR